MSTPDQPCDDLADALAALPIWESTEPVPRSIGGHEGLFMELNVPSEIPSKCQGAAPQLARAPGGTQGNGPGKTQLLWIVDVDGHRLMLVVGYFPGPEGPSPKVVDEMTRMAEEASFVDADQSRTLTTLVSGFEWPPGPQDGAGPS